MPSLWIYAYSLLTIVIFVLSMRLSARLHSAILNPFIIAIVLIIATLLLCHIPYKTYYEGNELLNDLLGVAVVSLAMPFYEQFGQIRKAWKQILLVVVFATLFSMISVAALAVFFGGSHSIIASILAKSVTTPIAIAITKEMGGEVAVSVVSVTIAGLIGSAFGISILKAFKIHNMQAIGLSMGAVSHALGTARTMEYDRQAGSYASIALVLCGVLSSIAAPIVFRIVVFLVE